MEKSSHTKVLAAHTSASLYNTTIQVRLLQILQLLRYIQTEGEMGTCFSLIIAAPYHTTAGMLSVYKTLGFVKTTVVNDLKEGWAHLHCKNLIPLPRYTLRHAFIKYRTPMIQFHKEDLFQNTKIQKSATIILLTVKGMFQNGQRYPSISMWGKARTLDVSDASQKIATSLKTLMKDSSQQKNLYP